MFSQLCNSIFNQCIRAYHQADDVEGKVQNPYPAHSLEHHLYLKCWIDTVQWHLEDLIRVPDIDPVEALKLKRRIDHLNQERTNLVEGIDLYFLNLFKDAKAPADAPVNTETLAWATDRLSILALKVYHMQHETLRPDAQPEHVPLCRKKLLVLLEQQKDLSVAIDTLYDDLADGRKRMKTYQQMKMYNDPNLNPALYHK